MKVFLRLLRICRLMIILYTKGVINLFRLLYDILCVVCSLFKMHLIIESNALPVLMGSMAMPHSKFNL